MEDDQATEPSGVELRLAEAIEKHNQAMRAKAIETHIQALKNIDSVGKSQLAKVLQKLKASREIKAMEGMDYVDRGDYYEESRLKEDYILFSGVPPITVKYPKTPVGPFCVSNLQAVKDTRCSIMNQVSQTIREAPKEIRAAYRQAYYEAIEEYDKRAKNKPPPDQYEEIEKTRDELLSLAQIKADQIIRDEQIRADQIRALYRKANPKEVGNQCDQVDPHLSAMLSVKGTFEESDIEKQISNQQALAELKAKQCIAEAHAKADRIFNCSKVLLASRREKYEKNYRDPREGRKFDEEMLGIKDNLSP